MTSSVIAIAKIGRMNGRALLFIQKRLDSGREEIREAAILSLGFYRSQHSLTLLQNLALDTDNSSRVRELAVIALGHWGGQYPPGLQTPEIPKALYELLANPSELPGLRSLAATALSQMGRHSDPEIVIELMAIQNHDLVDSQIRRQLPLAMSGILSQHSNPDFSNQVLQHLQKTLEATKEAGMAEACILGLSKLAQSGIDPCTSPCQEDCPQEKILSILFKHAASSPFYNCRKMALVSLARLGETTNEGQNQIFTFLLQQMEVGEAEIKAWAGLATGMLAYEMNLIGRRYDSARVHDRTLEHFQSTNDLSQKGAFALALGLMSNESSKPSLRRSLDEFPHPEYQGYAAVALGMLRAREYEVYLNELLEESVGNPKLFSQIYLGRMLSDDDPVPRFLYEMLQGEKEKRPRLISTALATMALGQHRHTLSVTPLLQFARREDISALQRAFAISALGDIAQAGILPWQVHYWEVIGSHDLKGSWFDPMNASGLFAWESWTPR